MSHTTDAAKPAVNVVFATNNNYVKPLVVAIESVIVNSLPTRKYEIVVLYHQLTEENIALLNSRSRDNCHVSCLNVSHLFDEQTMYSTRYLSPEMYFRLFIPEALPQFDRVLYLDCDMVTLRDVGELFDSQLDGYPLGAIRDELAGNDNRVVRELGLVKKDYINSGVLVMDATQLRAMSFKEKCLNELRARPNLPCPDQDVINIVCAGKIKHLDRRWNYQWQTDDPLTPGIPLSDPIIVHYASQYKPWNALAPQRLAQFFWDYARSTPVYFIFLEEIILDSNASLRRSKCTDTMIYQYAHGEVGFRYIWRFFKAWLGYKMGKR